MRKIYLTLAIICFAAAAMPLGAQTTSHELRKEEEEARRQARVQEREKRTAEYVQFIDSLVLSHTYNFNPTSMQRQPAGMVHQLFNPNFVMSVYPEYVDIYMPYIRGILPPYVPVMLNYALPGVNDYTAVQGEHGWTITFKTWLYSANQYTFTLTIFSVAGTAVLDISSEMYNTVSYNGSITKIY